MKFNKIVFENQEDIENKDQKDIENKDQKDIENEKTEIYTIQYNIFDENSIINALKSVKTKFGLDIDDFKLFKGGLQILIDGYENKKTTIDNLNKVKNITITNNEKIITVETNKNSKNLTIANFLLIHIFYDLIFLEHKLNKLSVPISSIFNKNELEKVKFLLIKIIFSNSKRIKSTLKNINLSKFLKYFNDNIQKYQILENIFKFFVLLFYLFNENIEIKNKIFEVLRQYNSKFDSNYQKYFDENGNIKILEDIKDFIISENLIYYFSSVFLGKIKLGENLPSCCEKEKLVSFIKRNLNNNYNDDNEVLNDFYQKFHSSLNEILEKNNIKESDFKKEDSFAVLSSKSVPEEILNTIKSSNDYYFFGISIKLNTNKIGGVLYLPRSPFTSKKITPDVTLFLKLNNPNFFNNPFNNEISIREKFINFFKEKYKTSHKEIIDILNSNKNNNENKKGNPAFSILTNILIRNLFYENFLEISYLKEDKTFLFSFKENNIFRNLEFPEYFSVDLSNNTDINNYLNIFYEMFYYAVVGDKNYINQFINFYNIKGFSVVKLVINKNNKNAFKFTDSISNLRNKIFNESLNKDFYCALNIALESKNNLLIIGKLGVNNQNFYKIFSFEEKGGKFFEELNLKDTFNTLENGFDIVTKSKSQIIQNLNNSNIIATTFRSKFSVYFGNQVISYGERKIGFTGKRKNKIYFQSAIFEELEDNTNNINSQDTQQNSNIVNEGGNALKFAGAKRLDADLLEKNFNIIKKNILSVLPVDQEDVIPIGSTFKKFTDYGDIDILLDTYGVYAETNFKGDALLEYIKSRLSLVFPQVQKVTDFCILTLLSPIEGRVSEYVQVDILPSNLYPKIDSREKDIEYMLFAFASPIEGQSKYKGAHRNILIQSLCDCITYNNNPIEFNPNLGLIVYDLDSPYCIRNVDLIIKILFKSEYDKEQLNSFEQVYIVIKRVYKDILDKIMQRFFERVSENKELLSYFQKDK